MGPALARLTVIDYLSNQCQLGSTYDLILLYVQNLLPHSFDTELSRPIQVLVVLPIYTYMEVLIMRGYQPLFILLTLSCVQRNVMASPIKGKMQIGIVNGM